MVLIFKIIVRSTFLFLIFFCLVFPTVTQAASNCDHRYVTFINPVRTRELWYDRTLKPVLDQYKLLEESRFKGTWLVQYDVLFDQELVWQIKGFGKEHEIGVFLEVSQKLGDNANVIYPYDKPWFDPGAVFLSGYTQSQRRKLIDKNFEDFNKVFGYYPKSVGAWWIDSYSLNYLVKKYGVKVAMIVADQKTTDNYGIWGQWWGVPYYPSKTNILTPASSLENQLSLVIIQWAQRDLKLAYGEGSTFSNYSLQANDYTRLGKDTKYFKEISNIYLDCSLPVGQITVGLETGIESVDYINEYKNQLLDIKERGIMDVTMAEFADKYKKVYPKLSSPLSLNYKDTNIVLELDKRTNNMLGESITYKQNVAFPDFFVADKSSFLNRKLPIEKVETQRKSFIWVIVAILIAAYSYRQKKLIYWVVTFVFVFSSFWHILRSDQISGWTVFYGPKVTPLIFGQIGLIFVGLILYIFIIKARSEILKKSYLFVSLSFAFDPIIQLFRYSFISGKHYIGIATNELSFLGLKFSNIYDIEFMYKDLPAYQAVAFLRLDLNKVWNNWYLWMLVYPFLHLIIGLLVGFIFVKFRFKFKNVILSFLIILLLFHLANILGADPRLVN